MHCLLNINWDAVVTWAGFLFIHLAILKEFGSCNDPENDAKVITKKRISLQYHHLFEEQRETNFPSQKNINLSNFWLFRMFFFFFSSFIFLRFALKCSMENTIRSGSMSPVYLFSLVHRKKGFKASQKTKKHVFECSEF